jgi:hypothetical protein
MKWFKHITDSLDDPFIFELMEQFGSDGYLTFFGVVEIYAREFQTENDWKLTVSWNYLHKKLLVSSQKLKKILSKIHKWDINYTDTHVTIFIPKFKQLLDESTLKKLRESEKSFRNSSGIIPKTEPTDKDKDKETPIVPSANRKLNGEAFATFWRVYPKKKSKGQAEKIFKKINPDEQLLASMIAKIEQAKKSEQWLKDGGQFIPHPATWLNAKGWEDEIETKPQATW